MFVSHIDLQWKSHYVDLTLDCCLEKNDIQIEGLVPHAIYEVSNASVKYCWLGTTTNFFGSEVS